MNRQLVLATLALATLAASGCGSSGPETAGKKIGQQVGALQTTAMVRMAQFRLEGIEAQLEKLKEELPASAYEQIEAIDKRLVADVTAAVNHPDALGQASVDARTRFDRLETGGNADVEAFKRGFEEGYLRSTD